MNRPQRKVLSVHFKNPTAVRKAKTEADKSNATRRLVKSTQNAHVVLFGVSNV